MYIRFLLCCFTLFCHVSFPQGNALHVGRNDDFNLVYAEYKYSLRLHKSCALLCSRGKATKVQQYRAGLLKWSSQDLIGHSSSASDPCKSLKLWKRPILGFQNSTISFLPWPGQYKLDNFNFILKEKKAKCRSTK